MPAQTPGTSNTDVEHTWLKPAQVEQMKDACLTTEFPTYLQDRNLALVSLMYDIGLRVGETVALDTENVELDDRRVLLPGSIYRKATCRQPRSASVGTALGRPVIFDATCVIGGKTHRRCSRHAQATG